MKKHTKFFAFIMVVLVLATSIITLKDVIAVESTSYRTTIINEDGLEIEIATIRSEDIIGTEEYIRANLNTAYANPEKFEPKDALYVKHLLADGSEFSGEKTIDAMYDGQEDAFIMMNDFATILYETDENSEYYVAFANTLIDDPDYQVTDHCFAYTNLDGEAVFDCIYDSSTGLVYVPKKYTEENKNGIAMNTQVELLQVIDAENPTSTLSVKVDVDENVAGTFATSGKITVEALATEFGVKVALDDEAINDITENYFKIMINDTETHAYKYYPNEGIIVVQALPNTIKTLEINISPDNIDDNVDYLMENGGVSAYATWEEIPVYGAPGEWIVTTMPNEGDSWYIESNPDDGYYADMVDVYRAGRVDIDGLPIYNEATDTDWSDLVDKIWHDKPVNLDNLVRNDIWIQHEVRFNKDITEHGITIPGGTVAWLKCSHANTSFKAENERSTDPVDGEPRDHAWKIKIKIYKITDDYMIVGFLTSILHDQAGTGIYKIAYTTGKGNLEVAKVDKHGDYIGGATFRITGENGYSTTVVTEDGKKKLIEDLDRGTYWVEEIDAPTNMVINRTPVEVTVKSNETVYAEIKNEYQRGSVSITKFDEEEREQIKGDATLAGAEFSLYAAEDIYEGRDKVYSKDEEIQSCITTNIYGETEPVTNLPIGNYYYRETKASEGFNINNTIVPVAVTYDDQNATVAATKYCEIAEPAVYGDVEIIKYLSATDYDPKINLAGSRFSLTLESDPTQVYYTNRSLEDGLCKATRIPYGTYIAEEVETPPEAMKIPNFPVVVSEHNETYTFEREDPSKTITIKIIKEDKFREEGDPANYSRGDCTLKGAQYTIYRDEALTDIVTTITVDKQDEDGYWYAESGTMRSGTYYVKETKTPPGYLIDPNVYVCESKKEDQLVLNKQLVEKSVEDEILGRVIVYKMDNDNNNDEDKNDTDKSPAAGAILKLTLISAKGTDKEEENSYYATIDDNGRAEFIDEEFKRLNPDEECTIPYGIYEITEVKESDSGLHTYYHINAENVVVNVDQEIEQRILMDEPVPMYIQVRKIDSDTLQPIKLAGAEFKIWDCAAGEFVKQKVYPDGKETEVFVTNDEGYFYTPAKLFAGEYIVYEVNAPEGYYLEDKLRLPENPEDFGNLEKGGKYVLIDKEALGVEEDATYPGLVAGNLVKKVEIIEEPLKAKLQVIKTGEMLTEIETKADQYGELTQPKYTYKALEGVEYTLTVKDDIKSPDGGTVYASKGKQYKIVTNAEGIATSEELYLGTYEIKETKTPKGFVTDTNIPDITLENENQYEEIKTTVKEMQNVKQKTKIEINKEFQQSEYIVNKDQKIKVAIGIYNRDAIKNYNQTKTLISEDTLIDVVSGECDMVGNKITLTSTVNLPAGKYYAKEIYVDAPYNRDESEYDFEVEFTETTSQQITIKTPNIYNAQDTGNITLIKLSTSSLGSVVFEGEELITEDADEKMNQILEDIKGLTEEEIKDYLADNNIKFVAGAEYSVFVDEECTQPLYIKDKDTGESKEVKLVTNDTGLIKVEDIPIGEYYLKETKAPPKYELSEEIVKIILTKEDKNSTVYKALKDDSVIKPSITKLDAFTGEPIAKCKFEVRDEEGNLLVYSVTDEKGEGYIPLDVIENGKKYTYTEIEAPDIYDLNTTPHEFTASYYIDYENEKVVWTGEKVVVENRRKPIKELIVRKIDEETGEPLEGCKFSIVLLDENGEPFVNSKGETIYLVENAVTKENGEYIVKNPSYGTYKFIEVEAPEGYEKAEEEMEGYVFTIDKNSPETIIFEVTNTGDIAVIALAAVAVVSIIGIAFVIIRNKKQRA